MSDRLSTILIVDDVADNRLVMLQLQSMLGNQRNLLINNIIDLAENQINLTSKEIVTHAKTVQKTM